MPFTEQYSSDEILKGLRNNNFSIKKTAESLGIARGTIYHKFKKDKELQISFLNGSNLERMRKGFLND